MHFGILYVYDTEKNDHFINMHLIAPQTVTHTYLSTANSTRTDPNPKS